MRPVVPLVGNSATVKFSITTSVWVTLGMVTVGSPNRLSDAEDTSTPVSKVKPRVTCAVMGIMRIPSAHSRHPLSLRAIHGEN